MIDKENNVDYKKLIDCEEMELMISINKSLKFIEDAVHGFVVDGMKSIRSQEME